MLVLKFSTPARHVSVGGIRAKLIHDLAMLANIVLSDEEKFAIRLCASEIVSNAINHGFGGDAPDPAAQLPIEVAADKETGRLRFTVTDPGRGVPTEQEEDPIPTNGRGLHIVRSYADAAGWEAVKDENGKVVEQRAWFELAVAALAPGRATDAQHRAAEEQPEVQDELDRRSRVARRIAVMTAASRVRYARPVIRIGTIGRGSRDRKPLDSGQGAVA